MNHYRGRFAPSPSGPLHFGSLVAALASWLDAKYNKGLWLLRMEDIDPPREISGAADDILRTLENHGLFWDEEVTYQSNNLVSYQQIIEQLMAEDKVYGCICTRKQIKSTGGIYQNTCRNKHYGLDKGLSIRLRVTKSLTGFNDLYQGDCPLAKSASSEDFIIKRKDGLFAYMLAVVVDDAQQHISHVIRGSDLLDTTAQQLNLFATLAQKPPLYGHLPLAVTRDGLKLSKQNHAKALSSNTISENLWQALEFLQQAPPEELRQQAKNDLLLWAIKNWRPAAFAGKTQIIHSND